MGVEFGTAFLGPAFAAAHLFAQGLDLDQLLPDQALEVLVLVDELGVVAEEQPGLALGAAAKLFARIDGLAGIGLAAGETSLHGQLLGRVEPAVHARTVDEDVLAGMEGRFFAKFGPQTLARPDRAPAAAQDAGFAGHVAHGPHQAGFHRAAYGHVAAHDRKARPDGPAHEHVADGHDVAGVEIDVAAHGQGFAHADAAVAEVDMAVDRGQQPFRIGRVHPAAGAAGKSQRVGNNGVSGRGSVRGQSLPRGQDLAGDHVLGIAQIELVHTAVIAVFGPQPPTFVVGVEEKAQLVRHEHPPG